MPILTVKRLHPRAVTPHRNHADDAGFDLTAAYVNERSGKTATFGTGLAFGIPKGHVLLVFSRSGHGFNENTRLANCVGVVDAGYTGEVFVKLTRDDGMPHTAIVGDRIAQAVLMKLPTVTIAEVDDLGDTARGANGLGSSGS